MLSIFNICFVHTGYKMAAGFLSFFTFLCFTIYQIYGLPDGTCFYNNTIYQPGDEFPATDGCNNCTCHYSFYSCTRCLCLPLEVGKRLITTNNNNNNNNNNVNVNINYNTVTSTSVSTFTGSVTCNTNNLVYHFAQGFTGMDGCTKCACMQTGFVCNTLKCPFHKPVQTDYHKCQYGGTVYNFGDTFDHTDGCNKCVCDMNSIQCTDAPACKPTPPAYDCTYQGAGYMSGQSFPHSDGCNMCQCTILGVMCTSNTCTTTTTTTTMAPFTCEWFGKFYHDGDVMPVDGCHTCTCQAGKAVCSAGMNCPIVQP